MWNFTGFSDSFGNFCKLWNTVCIDIIIPPEELVINGVAFWNVETHEKSKKYFS